MAALGCLGSIGLMGSPALPVSATFPSCLFSEPLCLGKPDPERFVWIKPGTFVMGSPAEEQERDVYEGPQTEVTISYAFWMGRYEVTQAEYVEVMGYNPSHWRGDTNLPVDTVRWVDATNYCARLTARERRAGRLPAAYVYRLPWEAEWEYACRAGTKTAFHYGPALRSGMSNFDGRYEFDASDYGSAFSEEGVFLNRTVPVGVHQPNAWGLHDMHGNIWEWCLDWWSPSLQGGKVTDPRGPASGPGRLRRGGFYSGSAWICRSAMRYWGNPVLTHENLGFRVVLAPERAPTRSIAPNARRLSMPLAVGCLATVLGWVGLPRRRHRSGRVISPASGEFQSASPFPTMNGRMLCLAVLLTGIDLWGQGTIVFNNLGGKLVKWGPGTPKAGQNVVAADQILVQLLWLNPATQAYEPVGAPVSNWPVPYGGVFNGGQRSVSAANTVAPGWTWRIRAWDSRFGSDWQTSYAACLTAGGSVQMADGIAGGVVEFQCLTGDPDASLAPQAMAASIPEFTMGYGESAEICCDVTRPGDPVQVVYGVNDGDGDAGPPPLTEGVEHALDNVGQKYLNFLDLGSGLAVQPSVGLTILTGLCFYAGNDAEERDPASYLLEGSITGLGGPWTSISSGPLNLPAIRNPGGSTPLTGLACQQVSFVNSTVYNAYRLTFPTLKNAAAANSMQIGEVEFLGTPAVLTCSSQGNCRSMFDRVSGYPVMLIGDAKQTDSRGGRTGRDDDHALDLGVYRGVGYVPDASFLNAATADDTLTIAFFQKLRSIRASSSVWINSRSINRDTLGFQAHLPWSDSVIYFDTSGCCQIDAQRISLGIDVFPNYTGDATWWQNWHHFALIKNGPAKDIYIDGTLFHEGAGDPLRTEFTTLLMGAGPGIDDNHMDGMLDDFVIYNHPLTEAQCQSLAMGAAPSSILGLIAHWDFNDSNESLVGPVHWWPGGGNANNIVGVHDGILQNGATFASGKVGTGFSLDGVDDRAVVPAFATDLPATEITVEFWQKVNAVVNQSTFSLSEFNPAAVFNAHVPYGDGRVYWDFGDIYNGGRLDYLPPESLVGSWQHFALVASRSGDCMRIYRNGVQEASKVGMTPLRGSGDLLIGGLSFVPFGGVIDELSIYNRALSEAEIQAIYSAGSTGKSVVPPSITSITKPADNVTLSWQSQRGLMYHVQYNTDLTTDLWLDLLGNVTASGATAGKTDTLPTGRQRFYRVKMFR